MKILVMTNVIPICKVECRYKMDEEIVQNEDSDLDSNNEEPLANFAQRNTTNAGGGLDEQQRT